MLRLSIVLMLLALTAAPAPARAGSAEDENDSFATGLVFEPETVYRSFPVVGTYRAFLPPAVDLSAFLPPVGSQGEQSSCVAWATSYGLRGYYENRRRGGVATAPLFSPAFIYNQIKSHSAGCDVGTSISDALNLMKQVGTVPWSRFPYDPHDCSRLPEPRLADDARPFRIADWKRVDSSRVDDIKGQLYAGNPVVIGMVVNRAFHRLRGDQVFEDTDTDGSGHAMVVVGYDDNREAFRLFNSWGRNWGDRGLGWVDYGTFRARTHAAFVMQVANRPVSMTPEPVPAPVPTPAPTPAPAAPAAGLSRINAVLADVPCSVLKVERQAGDRLTVEGVVGAAADRDRLARWLRREVGAGVGLDVAVMPWPQCEVRGTFAPALEHPAGLTVHVRASSAGRPVLTGGTALVLDVTIPSFPAYLYVIYLQAGGDAVFLYTPASTQGRPLRPDTRLAIGDGNAGTPRLAIGAPYGEEMILAVAAPMPLTSEEPAVTMTEREFLSLFRAAMLGHGSRGVIRIPDHSATAAAAYTVLTTKP